MKMVKFIVSGILIAALGVGGAMSASAEEPGYLDDEFEGTAIITAVDPNGDVTEEIFDIQDLYSVELDEAGNPVPQLRIAIGETTVGKGNIRYFYNASGNHFSVAANTTVTFKVKLNKAVKVQMGYAKKGNSRVATYSGSSKTPSTTFTLSSKGSYCFFLKNLGASSVTIKSGSIKF